LTQLHSALFPYTTLFRSKLDHVIKEMKIIFKSVPYGIDHTMRVLENAQTISQKENIDVSTQKVIELSAVLHDIGSVEALRKHGSDRKSTRLNSSHVKISY